VTELALRGNFNVPPFTAGEARRMMECLQNNPRLHTFNIFWLPLSDAAALNVLRNGLPLCTSVTKVKLFGDQLTNEGFEGLLPALYSTSVTSIEIRESSFVQGPRGGDVLRAILVDNNNIIELDLSTNAIGPGGVIGLGQRICTGNTRLQELSLRNSSLGNDGLAKLLLPAGGDNGMFNSSLTHLNLSSNNIEG
jgi:NLR family CARD domain-containing protein 3